MALPSLDHCKCSCHDPIPGMQAYHVGACCTGMTLAWGSWGMDDVIEMVVEPVEFSEEDLD